MATSLYQQFLSLVRGRPGQLNPPVDNMDELWTENERIAIEQQLRSSIAGSPKTVEDKLQSFLDATQADELIISSHIYHHQARLRSYEILSQWIERG